MDIKETVLEKIKALSDDAIVDLSEFRGDLAIEINPDRIFEVAELLKEDDELSFEMCVDVTAIDWATRKNRFTVVYHIYSLKNNFRLRLKATVKDSKEPEIDSVVPVWRSANWYERETWDMYGIKFRNHPDLRRIYLPEAFEYFPLRKEFPVMGIPGSLPLPKKEEE